MRELRTYAIDAKPSQGQIKEYFRSRLEGKQAGLSVGKDALGNTIFTSLGFQEATFNHPHPATLVVSPVGMDMIRRNRGLLHRIAEGERVGKKIGEGTEGNVYKINLKTDEGEKAFALKHTFPIKKEPNPKYNNAEISFFTPGIDQMRLLQLLQQQQVLPGLHVVAPILATMDITLAPYVDNAISYNAFVNATFSPQKLTELPVSEQHKQMLHELTENDRPFEASFSWNTNIAGIGLSQWLRNTLPHLPFALVSEQVSLEEPESPNNLLISLDKLHMLYESFKQKKDIFSSGQGLLNSQFVEMVKDCCFLIELTAGYERSNKKGQ